MIIDDSKFPVVFVNFQHSHSVDEDHGHEDSIAAFTSLFERKKPFVMISTGEVPEEKHKPSREETKQVNAWRKIHKEELKYTKATIQVEPSKVKRMGLSLFSTAYEKFWGNPLLFAETKAKAIEKAEQILREVSTGKAEAI
ncbi:hypothetical protein ACHRV6_21295 [Flavobacterium sp. FlaQc-51]|uniref:hypothetical protein n=1 Tax=Flavobacterium sp. FlaQc-51 TaxID=3374184 RepID=UPI00375808AD